LVPYRFEMTRDPGTDASAGRRGAALYLMVEDEVRSRWQKCAHAACQDLLNSERLVNQTMTERPIYAYKLTAACA
jgi:hypothetical protein